MDLTELLVGLNGILNTSTVSEISEKLYAAVKNHETDVYQKYVDLVGGDLEKDYMQMVYQYYMADRKNLSQDFTPRSLAKLAGLLAGNANHIVDMCAGSGALTIQKWSQNKNIYFELLEYDEKVIPFLLFNMAVRNISCKVIRCDVLQQEIFREYQIVKDEKFGRLKE